MLIVFDFVLRNKGYLIFAIAPTFIMSLDKLALI